VLKITAQAQQPEEGVLIINKIKNPSESKKSTRLSKKLIQQPCRKYKAGYLEPMPRPAK
jgi:hypothetical protein